MASNYPMGAEHDPNAPWNQVETTERDFGVIAEYSLTKSTEVSTNNYCIDDSPDGEGGGDVFIDTDNVDWEYEFENQHRTPLQLINILKEYAEKELKKSKTENNRKDIFKWNGIIADCSDWEENLIDCYKNE